MCIRDRYNYATYHHLILASDLVSNPTSAVSDGTASIGGVLGAVLFLLIIGQVSAVMLDDPLEEKKVQLTCKCYNNTYNTYFTL